MTIFLILHKNLNEYWTTNYKRFLIVIQQEIIGFILYNIFFRFFRKA